MSAHRFPWGKVLDRFEFDFDGVKLEVTKYLPTKFVNGHAVKGEHEDEPEYHIDEMSGSFGSMDAALIGWITHRRLGLNNNSLAYGICRALKIEE